MPSSHETIERHFVPNRKIALIGAASSAGARELGLELTPAHMRGAGLLEKLGEAGLEVIDLGDLPIMRSQPDVGAPNQRNLDGVVTSAMQVADMVDRAIALHAWPLVIGGDCTVTIGVLAGLARHHARLGLMYFDGDLDLNTPDTTPSGIFDGMGLAHVIGRGVPALNSVGRRIPLVNHRNVTAFGYSRSAGSIDPNELDVLAQTEITSLPLESIAGNARSAAAKAMRELERRTGSILVHFDVDVVDEVEFPAAEVPHTPGLSLADTRDSLGEFLCSPHAVGFVVAEFNSRRDPTLALAHTLIDVLVSAMRPATARTL